MTDWTPPEAMVEEVAQQVVERLFTVNPVTKPGTERVAREVVRATLAASPIGELVEALVEIETILIEDTNAEDHPCCGWGPTLKMVRAALARARGEVK